MLTRSPIVMPTGNLGMPMGLTSISLDCARKSEYPQQTHQEREKHAMFVHTDPEVEVETLTLDDSANR